MCNVMVLIVMVPCWSSHHQGADAGRADRDVEWDQLDGALLKLILPFQSNFHQDRYFFPSWWGWCPRSTGCPKKSLSELLDLTLPLPVGFLSPHSISSLKLAVSKRLSPAIHKVTFFGTPCSSIFDRFLSFSTSYENCDAVVLMIPLFLPFDDELMMLIWKTYIRQISILFNLQEKRQCWCWLCCWCPHSNSSCTALQLAPWLINMYSTKCKIHYAKCKIHLAKICLIKYAKRNFQLLMHSLATCSRTQ